MDNKEKRYKIEEVKSATESLFANEENKIRICIGLGAIGVAAMVLIDVPQAFQALKFYSTMVLTGTSILRALESLLKMMNLKITVKDLMRLKEEGNDSIGEKYEGKSLGVIPSIKKLDDDVVAKLNHAETLQEIYERWEKEQDGGMKR
jgi:hypothetical protein